MLLYNHFRVTDHIALTIVNADFSQNSPYRIIFNEFSNSHLSKRRPNLMDCFNHGEICCIGSDILDEDTINFQVMNGQ